MSLIDVAVSAALLPDRWSVSQRKQIWGLLRPGDTVLLMSQVGRRQSPPVMTNLRQGTADGMHRVSTVVRTFFP